MIRYALLVIFCLVLTLQPAVAAGPKRIAVLDFRNLSKDNSLDKVGIGVAERVAGELRGKPSLRVIERSQMDAAQKEIRFSMSAAADAATVHQTGKYLSVDWLVVGTIQMVAKTVWLEAHVFDVETGVQVPVPDLVSHGPHDDLLLLQKSLAEKVSAGLDAALKLPETPPLDQLNTTNLAAYAAFSDGLYFLRKDLARQALDQFDTALKLDPNYMDAHYQRGRALERLGRHAEAIPAFLAALPRASEAHRIAWEWLAPAAADGVHGLIQGAPVNRFVYAERKSGETRLRFLEPAMHTTVEATIPDEHILMSLLQLPGAAPRLMAAVATETFTILLAGEGNSSGQLNKIRLHAFGKDGSYWWSMDLDDLHDSSPAIRSAGDGFSIYWPQLQRLQVFEARHHDLRYQLDGIPADEQPLFQHTQAFGDIVVLKSDRGFRALRISDKSQPWLVAVESPLKDYAIAGSKLFSVESARLVMIDMETAKLRITPAKQRLTSARVDGDRAYVGTETGDCIVVDARTGAVIATEPVTSGTLNIEFAAGNTIVASSASEVFGLFPSGKKQWSFPANYPFRALNGFKDMVAVNVSANEVVGLDGSSGKMVWRHTSTGSTFVLATTGRDAHAVVDDLGVREYVIEKNLSATDLEILTDLASAYLAIGDADNASAILDKAAGIEPNFPSIHLVRSRLLHSANELATYANLVGRGSLAGREALAELKKTYNLSWTAEIAAAPAGPQLMVAGKALIVQRSNGFVGLNAVDGSSRFSQPVARLLDAVAPVTDDLHVWYVGGAPGDPKGLVLYSLDLRSGEARELKRWQYEFAVGETIIVHAGNQACVGAFGADGPAQRLSVGVRCMNDTTGELLWEKTHEAPANPMELLRPVGLFVALKDSLVYSFQQQVFVVGAGGTITANYAEKARIGRNVWKEPPADGLVRYSNTLRELVTIDPVTKGSMPQGPLRLATSQLLVRDGVLFAVGEPQLLRVDLKSGERLEVPGAFLDVLSTATRVFARRNDNVVLELDPRTLKVLATHELMWVPATWVVTDAGIYGVTTDGLVFATRFEE